MTRGNQRDLAREKAAKKDKGKSKAANEQAANAGMTKEQRMARYCIIQQSSSLDDMKNQKCLYSRDAEIMRQKQQKKAEAAAAGGSGGGKK